MADPGYVENLCFTCLVKKNGVIIFIMNKCDLFMDFEHVILAYKFVPVRHFPGHVLPGSVSYNSCLF